MDSADRGIVGEWITKERTGKPDEADQAFGLVAEVLPRRAPSAAFVAAVMARVAQLPSPVASWWLTWGVKATVSASLVTLGVVLGSWSPRSMLFAAIAGAEMLVWGLGQVVAGSVAWVETGLTVWGSAAHAAVVVGRMLTAPGPAVVVGVNLAVAAGACVALRRLLAAQEE